MSLNKEFFKPIPSTDGVYGISETGEVVRIVKSPTSKGGILKTYCDSHGYKRLRVCIQGKTRLVYLHRLLAEAYLDNSDNKPCVNHIDGDKLNNDLPNLEWVTYSENTQHAVANNLHIIGENCYNYKHGKYSKHKKGNSNV